MWFIFNIICLLLLKTVISSKCEAPNKLTVYANDDRNRLFVECVDSSVQDSLFNGYQIEKIVLDHNSEQTLKKETVKNMKHLQSISYYSTQGRDLESKVFENLPNLQAICLVMENLQKIPKDVFSKIPSLQRIILQANQISIIEKDAFSELPNLEEVDVSSNKLKSFKPEWFSNTVNIQVLDFQENEITSIPPKAFAGFRQLREVYLNSNKISIIGEGAFEGIEHLDHLGLERNHLTQIQDNIFPNNIAIDTLGIAANYLNFLSSKLRKKVQVSEIIMHGNPWKCACFDEIKLWLEKSNAVANNMDCSRSDVPVCAVSVITSPICEEKVDSDVNKVFFEALSKVQPRFNRECAQL